MSWLLTLSRAAPGLTLLCPVLLCRGLMEMKQTSIVTIMVGHKDPQTQRLSVTSAYSHTDKSVATIDWLLQACRTAQLHS